jgi:hypothetical protein
MWASKLKREAINDPYPYPYLQRRWRSKIKSTKLYK